ncbi:LexA family protein [Bradyrhizobium barranii]|uniref:LexA family protein n=1 Tax=Bradyrhizobium TaxID=374 RepID=UPI003F24C163
MSQKSGAHFTEKQGHYLAFIHTYAYMFGRPPAEADIQRHFRVSPPSVHQMIVILEQKRLHPTSTRRPQKHRNPRAARKLADPRMARHQNIKITVVNY